MNSISEHLYRKASVKKIPLSGTFELSPICNFHCKMCYVRRTREQIDSCGKRLRTYQEWLWLAEECKKAGMLYLLLTGGEPFLYPEFKTLYIQLHKMGFLISINSNGVLIDEETRKWLKQYPPYRINVTLYGISGDTYERVCGSREGYLKTIRNVKELKKIGINVVINVSMIPENAKDLQGIIEFGKDNEIPTRVSTYMFPPVRREREDGDSRFTPEESAKMYMEKYRYYLSSENLKKYIKGKLDTLQEDKMGLEESYGVKRDEHMKCRAGRSAFWVSWEGVMTACGILPFPLEVYPFEKSFYECWTELTNEVRKSGVLKGCRDCQKKDICEPCVAMIHAETGTTDEKAPYLCSLTECIIQKMNDELA